MSELWYYRINELEQGIIQGIIHRPPLHKQIV